MSLFTWLFFSSDETSQAQQFQQGQNQQIPPSTSSDLSASPSTSVSNFRLGWRNDDDSDVVPAFGSFQKIERPVRLISSRAAEFHQLQHEAEILLGCHCALHLEGVIQCRSTFVHSQHRIASSSSSSSSSSGSGLNNNNKNKNNQKNKGHQEEEEEQENNSENNKNELIRSNNNGGENSTMHSRNSNLNPHSPKEPYLEIEERIRREGLLAPHIPACRVHELMQVLPGRYREVQWKILFCSDVDGFSIRSFYSRLENRGAFGACLLVAEVSEILPQKISSPLSSLASGSAAGSKEENNQQQQQQQQQQYGPTTVIGAFLSDMPTLSHGSHHFFGSRETFVFSFDDDFNSSTSTPSKSLSSSSLSNSFCDDYYDDQDFHSISNKKKKSSSRRNSLHQPHSNQQHQLQQQHQREKGKLRTHHWCDPGSSSSHSTPTNVRSSPSSSSSSSSSGSPPSSAHYYQQRSDAEHFIICSHNSLGVGGGEDGAALFFHENFQKGTSSVSCGAFSNSLPLAGKPRQGLRHSEFRTNRLFLFALDDSDFVEYMSKAELKETQRKVCGDTNNSRSNSNSASSFEEANVNNNNAKKADDFLLVMSPKSKQKKVFAEFPTRGCTLEPRGHHNCSLVATEANKRKNSSFSTKSVSVSSSSSSSSSSSAARNNNTNNSMMTGGFDNNFQHSVMTPPTNELF